MSIKTIAMVGNPNVGKSTVFNKLTGMHQHTGNWPGKTVAIATGKLNYKNDTLEFIDLPGTYSLNSTTPDEMVTSEYIKSNSADIILIIADATCMQRNLLLVKDILKTTSKAVLCINLIDEARRKGITVNTDIMEHMLGIPVIPIIAKSGDGFQKLLDTLHHHTPKNPSHISIDVDEIYNKAVTITKTNPHNFDRKLDNILTSKLTGIPIMILLLAIIFWITVTGANYPSTALSSMFDFLKDPLQNLMQSAGFPSFLVSLLMDGIYSTVTWVVSVMLPPMAIFFPLFTLLEDFGYLPRIAFNLDKLFKTHGAHGKQALTMCMGLGCNACGVMGCRIINSPKERLIAIITNNFVPCNGRFPILINMILLFCTAGVSAYRGLLSGLILTMFIIFSVVITLLVSKLLSKTVLDGMPSSFLLELPPYRIPKVRSVIIHSVFDRTLFVLARAIIVAAPAGIIIWILSHTNFNDTSLLETAVNILDPIGNLIGVDGVIITALLLSFPANELFIPIMLMCYMSTGVLTEYADLSQLYSILTDFGWTIQTALCVIILCLFHFPCGTTLLTIKKETGSLKWTAVSFIIPTIIGFTLCLIFSFLPLAAL